MERSILGKARAVALAAAVVIAPACAPKTSEVCEVRATNFSSEWFSGNGSLDEHPWIDYRGLENGYIEIKLPESSDKTFVVGPYESVDDPEELKNVGGVKVFSDNSVRYKPETTPGSRNFEYRIKGIENNGGTTTSLTSCVDYS